MQCLHRGQRGGLQLQGCLRNRLLLRIHKRCRALRKGMGWTWQGRLLLLWFLQVCK
jgi:hypothetical protein